MGQPVEPASAGAGAGGGVVAGSGTGRSRGVRLLQKPAGAGGCGRHTPSAAPDRATAAVLPGQPDAGLAAQAHGRSRRRRRRYPAGAVARGDRRTDARVSAGRHQRSAPRRPSGFDHHQGGGIGLSAQAQARCRRSLKAFVDAQWLADFDARLEGYRTALSGADRDKEAGR